MLSDLAFEAACTLLAVVACIIFLVVFRSDPGLVVVFSIVGVVAIGGFAFICLRHIWRH